MSIIERIIGYFATPYGRLLSSKINSEWQTPDGYRLYSPDGAIDIWIANKAYALRVASKSEWPNKPKGIQYSPCWADRQLIWRAVKRLHLPTIRDFELRAAMDCLRSPVAPPPSNAACVVP